MTIQTPAQAAREASEHNVYPPSKGGRDYARERAEARMRWKTREYEITLEFQNALADEFAADLPQTVQVEIFRRAWDDGHAEGYERVEQEYEELAEFARMIRSAK